MTIKQAIQLIEKNSNYTFFYNAADLKNTTNKNLNCEGTIEEVLKEVFKGSGITYMIKGNEIILKVNKEEAAQQQPKKKRTVTGTVVDAENGDPVIGATVVVKGQKDGVIHDCYQRLESTAGIQLHRLQKENSRCRRSWCHQRKNGIRQPTAE